MVIMQSFQNAVDKAISVGGPDIFENRQLFLDVIEDLVPYHENDYKFLRMLINNNIELGTKLKEAYNSEDNRSQYYSDIVMYLLDEVGLSEKKAAQFVDYFSFLKNCSNNNKSDISTDDSNVYEKNPLNKTEDTQPKRKSLTSYSFQTSSKNPYDSLIRKWSNISDLTEEKLEGLILSNHFQIQYGKTLADVVEDIKKYNPGFKLTHSKKNARVADVSIGDIEKKINEYIEKGSYDAAIHQFDVSEQFLMSSEKYSDLCLMLGEYLEEKDPQKAMRYLDKSARRGNSRALFLLGYMYENGEGVVADLNKALEYYQKAANGGNRGAQHNIGCFYYFGKGVEKNYKLAYKYFLKAAEQGKADSMKNIGVMYEIGQHVAQDYQKALEWYNKAGRAGDYEADEYYRLLEKKINYKSSRIRVLFRVLNKDSEKKDMFFNVGEEIRGSVFSEHLTAKPVFKLLFNEGTKQVGIKNLSGEDLTIVKKNSERKICTYNKTIPIEQGDMIKIINRVVQLNVVSIEREG